MAEERDPAKAFLAALREYLRDRGHMLFSMSSGQSIVRLALRGLWRRHDTSTGYLRFMDAVRELRRNPDAMEKLREYGVIRFEVFEGEPYVLVDLQKLRKMLNRLMSGDEA